MMFFTRKHNVVYHDCLQSNIVNDEESSVRVEYARNIAALAEAAFRYPVYFILSRCTAGVF